MSDDDVGTVRVGDCHVIDHDAIALVDAVTSAARRVMGDGRAPKRRPSMTPAELTAIRERLGLGPVDMGRAMGVSYTTYRDWQSGRSRIPAVAARCADMLLMMDEEQISTLIDRTRRSKT